MDDPCRAKTNIADLKSFLTTDEDGTVDSRYNDTRLARNQLRAFASNDLPQERFDCQAGASKIGEEDFFSLLSDIFEGDKEKDVLAILKRSIVILFGTHAMYLRLPSERRNGIVHRITVDAVHEDLLADHDKPLYGKYKGGCMETSPAFDADVQKEQDILEKAVARMEEHEKIHTYIELVNQKLQDKLLYHEAKSAPASPTASNEGSENSPAHVAPAPVPPVGTNPCRRRRGNFVYPDPLRRVRAKTSPEPNLQELAEDADGDARDLFGGDHGAAEDEDLDGDAEAACHMGLNDM